MKFLTRFRAVLVATATLGFSQVASAIPMLSFGIDGNTAYQPFAIYNHSTEGEYVTGFHLDITGTGACFDIVNGAADACPGNGANGLVEFDAIGGSDVATGLVSPTVHDGDTVLDLQFTDFGVGELLFWHLDVDPFGGGLDGTILGSDLIGAQAWVDFSNGERVFATLGALVGNSDASVFTAEGQTSPVVSPPAVDVPAPSTLALLAVAALGLRRFRVQGRA